MKKVIALNFLLFYFHFGFSQKDSWHEKTKDDRYIISLRNHVYKDRTTNLNHSEMISDFSLGLEWWILMGEPIEIYEFRWQNSGSFRIDTSEYRTQNIYRSYLEKYPDLLKRFDNLRPSEVAISLHGGFSSWRHMDPIEEGEPDYQFWPMYVKPSETGYHGDFPFYYVIGNTNLIITTSGKVGKDIIPSSPLKWQDFLQYNYSWSMLGFGENNDNGDNDTENLSLDEQKERNKQLGRIFSRSKKMNIYQITLIKLEWPEYEMQAIAELYNQYEKGEKELSPLEEVKEELETLASTKPYNKDDFWGDAFQEIPLKPKKNESTGRWGYENELGEKIIPNLYDKAEPFENGRAIVTIENKKGVIDKSGLFIIQPKYDKIIQIYENVAIIGLNTSEAYDYRKRNISTKYGLINMNGDNITPVKFSSITNFENGFAKAEIFDHRKILDYEDCGDKYLDYFESGIINLTGNWVKPPIQVLEEIHQSWGALALNLSVRSDPNETASQRAARKRREAREKAAKKERQRKARICQEQKKKEVESYKNEIISGGGEVR